MSAKILQLGAVEISSEITGVYMRVNKGEWRPITYDQMWEIARPRAKTGPKSADPRRLEFCRKFGLRPSRKQMKFLTIRFMDQLDRCRSNAARRLLLGVSR